ncbi:MAG: hypothetical protein AB4042_09785 [Leptolyngbyaceae cyanobacterium]
MAALPSQIVDASRLVAQSCAAGAIAQTSNEFVIVGQGGISPAPGNTSIPNLWEDIRVPASLNAIVPSDQVQELSSPAQRDETEDSSTMTAIVPSSVPQDLQAAVQPVRQAEVTSASAPTESQGWLRDQQGNIILITELTTMMASTESDWLPRLACGLE